MGNPSLEISFSKHVCHVLKTVEEKTMKINIKLCPVIIVWANTLKVQMKCE